MIYLIGPEESAIVKIGHTTNQPSFRLGNLQTGNHQQLVVRWAGEGDEVLEKHLHAVFKDYRIRGEWFDLSPLGDPVQAVKDEIRKASERVAGGKALLAAGRHHDNAPRPELKAFDEVSKQISREPEMRQRRVIFEPPSRLQSWDERFPAPAGRTGATELKVGRQAATERDPRPGCCPAGQVPHHGGGPEPLYSAPHPVHRAPPRKEVAPLPAPTRPRLPHPLGAGASH